MIIPYNHTHSFRHKFTTYLLQKGANLRTIQELLDHTSLSVTERYLAVTDESKSWAVGLLDGIESIISQQYVFTTLKKMLYIYL
jgi:integrase